MLAPLLALAATAAPADLSGVWEGTIGALPVRACFASRDWGSFGAYYYMSRRRLIELEGDERSSALFREGAGSDPSRPRWRIESAGSGRLTAQWTGRGRTLPIRLSRVANPEGEEGPCGSLAFHGPRLEGIRTETARASTDGVAYSRITLNHDGRFDVGIETFALDGPGAAAGLINATLRQSMAGDPPDWFDCVRTPLAQGPNEGSLNQRLAPAMISRRWMSVTEQFDDFCGGAHPNHGQRYRTFDLAGGAEIDLHDWFNATAVRRQRFESSEEDIKTLEPALTAVILAGWRPDDEGCEASVRTQEFWTIGLTRDSLIFAPDLAHVAQACGEEFRVTFERLRPFLTEEGAANLRALRAERTGN